MKTIYIEDAKHKRLKLKCIENDLQITELLDEILEHFFEKSNMSEVISDAVKRKESRQAVKKGGVE